MLVNKRSYFADQNGTENDLDVDDIDGEVTAPSIPSVAEHCVARNRARECKLRKITSKQLALKLSEIIGHRLGGLWKPVSDMVASWLPKSTSEGPSTTDVSNQHIRGP